MSDLARRLRHLVDSGELTLLPAQQQALDRLEALRAVIIEKDLTPRPALTEAMLNEFTQSCNPYFTPASTKSVPEGKSTPCGRNDQCPCGSGQKYKNCCRRKDNA